MITESMSLGTKFINSIGLTILGMGVVFAVLIALSFALDILRIVAGQDNKKKDTTKQEVAKAQEPVKVSPAPKEDDEKLVAVIAAAIAAFQGTTIENIIVRSIRPVPQKETVWGNAGRQQQMLERL